jgi:hypothetical protein
VVDVTDGWLYTLERAIEKIAGLTPADPSA